MGNEFSHINNEGKALMVDVSLKEVSKREATAIGCVFLKRETIDLIENKAIPKGDIFSCARIAGIMAAKKTSEIIPLCHPLPIEGIEVDFEIDKMKNCIIIKAKTLTTGKTGVEMEALTAVSGSCLCIYDMCKAVDKEMVIGEIRLINKKKCGVK